MTSSRRFRNVRLARLIGGLAFSIAAGSVLAQAFPSKTIHIVSPLPPGGGNDLICRAVAMRLGPRLGQSVIVENKPGANTIVGADYVAKSAPDGYTFVLVPTQHVYNPSIYDKMPYDPIKDFTPITMVGISPLLVAAHADAPFRNLKELIQYAKSRPADEVTFGTAGSGSSGHLAGALLGKVAGVQFQHVAYRGAGPAAQALLTREVMMNISPPPALLPQVRAGKMIAIGITSGKRSQAAPDVPTIAEQGLSDFDAGLWYGFLGPARMQRDVVTKLNAGIAAVVADKDMKEVLAKLGIDAVSTTPEEFARIMDNDLKRWSPIVKTLGLKPE
jgi:tripartite-type tricarboxylate transporter receptor subunit TctC